MSIKLTMPQAELLQQLRAAGKQGIFKDVRHTPSEYLVQHGFARWERRYSGGTGKLVITDAGREFGR